LIRFDYMLSINFKFNFPDFFKFSHILIYMNNVVPTYDWICDFIVRNFLDRGQKLNVYLLTTTNKSGLY
jgi:hypothetical protein